MSIHEMSGLSLGYDTDQGGGEITYFGRKTIQEPLKLAARIAGAIVCDILEEAYNIVINEEKQLVGTVETKIEMIPPKGGVGDQLDETLDNKIALGQQSLRKIEKKSRVTDLLKNSPKIITEYLIIDQNAKQKQDEWEEAEEKFIQTIDIDENKVDSNLLPSDDNILDIVDLTGNTDKEEEDLQLSVIGDKREAEENEHGEMSKINNAKGDKAKKKKKWNFGAKFWNFLKKDKHGSLESSKGNY